MSSGIVVRASFPQGWRGDTYGQDEIMPATEEQGRRLTQAGVAYYDFVEDESENLTEDLSSLPSDDLLKQHFRRIEDVENASDEELLAIDGIGPKTLEEIREYFDGE